MKTIIFTHEATTFAFPMNSIRSLKLDNECAGIYVGDLTYIFNFRQKVNLQNALSNFLQSTVDNAWTIPYDTVSILPMDSNFGMSKR